MSIPRKANPISVRTIREAISNCQDWSENARGRHLEMLKKSVEKTIPVESPEYGQLMTEIARATNRNGHETAA